MARGQKKIAAAAYGQCESLLKQMEDGQERATCERLLEEVQHVIEREKTLVKKLIVACRGAIHPLCLILA